MEVSGTSALLASAMVQLTGMAWGHGPPRKEYIPQNHRITHEKNINNTKNNVALFWSIYTWNIKSSSVQIPNISQTNKQTSMHTAQNNKMHVL